MVKIKLKEKALMVNILYKDPKH